MVAEIACSCIELVKRLTCYDPDDPRVAGNQAVYRSFTQAAAVTFPVPVTDKRLCFAVKMADTLICAYPQVA
jgi:hypothetical protein